MSFLRRLKLEPRVLFEETITAVEYEDKKLDPKFKAARELYFMKEYSMAEKGFLTVIKQFKSDDMNHKLASFYLMLIERLPKQEDKRKKTLFPSLVKINI